MIGLQNKRKFYIIDFGLARKFRRDNGQIIPARTNPGFKGTARYASIHSHNNEDLSRRDDLWSVFYIIIEMLQGALPWGKLKEKDEIKQMKFTHSPEELVKDLPVEFENFINHLQGLDFSDEPDYAYLRGLLKGLYVSNGGKVDSPYPWEDNYQDINIVDVTSSGSFNLAVPTDSKKFKLVSGKRLSMKYDDIQEDLEMIKKDMENINEEENENAGEAEINNSSEDNTSIRRSGSVVENVQYSENEEDVQSFHENCLFCGKPCKCIIM